jgi:hypothetical protein
VLVRSCAVIPEPVFREYRREYAMDLAIGALLQKNTRYTFYKVSESWNVFRCNVVMAASQGRNALPPIHYSGSGGAGIVASPARS